MDDKSILAVIIVIISGIIGFAVIDSITTSTITGINTNETVGTADASGSFSGSLLYTPLSTPSVYANGILQTANVTVSAGSKTITTSGANFAGKTVKAYYDYTQLSGGLSKTIIAFIVPICLLGLLALTAGIMG